MSPYQRTVLHIIWQARKATRSFDRSTDIGHHVVLEMWKKAAAEVEKFIGSTLSSEMKPVYWFNNNAGLDHYPDLLLNVVKDFEDNSLNKAIAAWAKAQKSQRQVDLANSMKLPIRLSPEQYASHTNLISAANAALGRHLHVQNFSASLEEMERILTIENLGKGHKEHGD
jgi:hypothetical protein